MLEIISSTFALKKERTYKTWALSLGSDGSDKDRGKNLMTEHVKHSVIHQSSNKTVFIVDDMHNGKHYAMKEILSVPTIHNLPSTNEHEIVQHIYAGMNMASGGPLEGRTGIIEVPDIFREPVKVSMVYPLYYLDLFQAINYNTEIFRTEGFSEIVIVTFVAQLLEALLLLKKRRGEKSTCAVYTVQD